ncbi:MAG: helix-turn-helix transcriptional regulator [Saccharofermentanales bacterium]
MPKSENQKMKLLYLMQMFHNETDLLNKMTLSQIISYMKFHHNIEVERKTVYTDIALLRDFGMDIVMSKGKTAQYSLDKRVFELPELKLLVDAVQSSKFITTGKSSKLIRKLETLTSRYESGKLQRDVVVSRRIKNMNESIYLNVDTINDAIMAGKQVSFNYFEYDINKKKHYRRNGKVYSGSPVFLHWDSENYYMVTYCSEDRIIKHYRVDRMINISLKSADSEADKAGIDRATYSNRVFSMFTGEEVRVDLEFSQSLINVVIDRFGRDVLIDRIGDGTFQISVRVELSDVFLGWLLQFGSKVRVISPESLVARYTFLLGEVLLMYQT